MKSGKIPPKTTATADAVGDREPGKLQLAPPPYDPGSLGQACGGRKLGPSWIGPERLIGIASPHRPVFPAGITVIIV